MKVVLEVDNARIEELLNYLKELDFVSVDESQFELSEEQIQALNEGMDDAENGKVLSNDWMLKETRVRYSRLFKK